MPNTQTSFAEGDWVQWKQEVWDAVHLSPDDPDELDIMEAIGRRFRIARVGIECVYPDTPGYLLAACYSASLEAVPETETKNP